jgi:protein SDA1
MVVEGTSNHRGALLVQNLPALQGLLKRDPRAYAEEFAVQWQHYESQRRLIELGMAGREAEERWRELVTFIAQVSSPGWFC